MTAALYITADRVGAATGGGSVTHHEAQALTRFFSQSEVDTWSFPETARPWGADDAAVLRLAQSLAQSSAPKLAHLYSGTFTRTVQALKRQGTKVIYTAAAHDIQISREEHEKLGLPFAYPHLTEPEQWENYVRGYLLADVVICPSSYSKRTMESYGCKNVVVIPHGISDFPHVKPAPSRFAVAYLGQPGPDKGLIYLLRAWKQLNYKDATLTIAGYGTEHLLPWVRSEGGGNIHLRGPVESISDVYNACTLYVQPSASEGFGIEVIEAMAHGRPVVCSRGAGAADVLHESCTAVDARSAEALASAIDEHRKRGLVKESLSRELHTYARRFDWEHLMSSYFVVYEKILGVF